MDMFKWWNKQICLFFFLLIQFLALATNGYCTQDVNQQANIILDALSTLGTDQQATQEQKDAIEQLIQSQSSNSNNNSLNELIKMTLLGGQSQTPKTTDQLSPVYTAGIEEIVDILNPSADAETKRKQKELIIQILKGDEGNDNNEQPERSETPQQDQKTSTYPENLAQKAEVSVSNEFQQDLRKEFATDLNDKTEWATQGSKNQWFMLSWDSPVDIERIELIGRKRDQNARIWNSEFIFSDGTTWGIGSLNPGENRSIDPHKKGISWLKYYIHDGQNDAGLTEIIVTGTANEPFVETVEPISMNLAQKAKISASSFHKKRNRPQKAIDRKNETQWVAKNNQGQWIQLNWDEPFSIDTIKLTGRTLSSGSEIYDSLLMLSDGTIAVVGPLKAAEQKEIDIYKENISWIKYYIRDSKNRAGISEIEVIGEPALQFSCDKNLAQLAEIEVSDQLSEEFPAMHLADRRYETAWRANGSQDKWISLVWEDAVNIASIVFVGVTGNTNSQLHASDIILSDGTITPLQYLSNNQEQRVIIDKKGIRWLKLYIRKGNGNIGLSEIRVEEI